MFLHLEKYVVLCDFSNVNKNQVRPILYTDLILLRSSPNWVDFTVSLSFSTESDNLTEIQQLRCNLLSRFLIFYSFLFVFPCKTGKTWGCMSVTPPPPASCSAYLYWHRCRIRSTAIYSISNTAAIYPASNSKPQISPH